MVGNASHDALDLFGLRLVQLCTILRNLSLDSVNVSILASHPLVLRFVSRALAAHNSHAFLVRNVYTSFKVIYKHRVVLHVTAFDILACLSQQIVLGQMEDEGLFVAGHLIKALSSSDRSDILSALITLGD